MEDKLLARIERDIQENRLLLPALPEVSVRVRRLVHTPGSTAHTLADAIAADPVLAARLLKVANSVLLRGSRAIADLPAAITRLGHQLVHTLVTGAVMLQMYGGTHPVIRRRLHDAWDYSTRVAGLSHALANRHTRINPDVAMLAGLLHDIGRLPLLRSLQQWPAIITQDRLVDLVADRLHPRVGALMLEHWKFDAELVGIARDHEDLQAPTENSGPTLLSVVQVAMLAALGPQHPRLVGVALDKVPALRQLGLRAEEVFSLQGELLQHSQRMQQSLNV